MACIEYCGVRSKLLTGLYDSPRVERRACLRVARACIQWRYTMLFGWQVTSSDEVPAPAAAMKALVAEATRGDGASHTAQANHTTPSTPPA